MRVAKKSLGKVAKDFLQAVNCGRAALQRRVSDGTYAGFSPGRIGGWPTLSDHRIWVAHSLRCLQRVGFPTLSHLRFVVSQFHANQTFESCGIPPPRLRGLAHLFSSTNEAAPLVAVFDEWAPPTSASPSFVTSAKITRYNRQSNPPVEKGDGRGIRVPGCPRFASVLWTLTWVEEHSGFPVQ